MAGFVKLDCGLLDSTLWFDTDACRIFLTALLMAQPHELYASAPQLHVDSLEHTGWTVPAGRYGFIPAAGVGIIRRSGLSDSVGFPILAKLGTPEADTRTTDFEGRRLVRIDGGYLVLNYFKYRNRDYGAAARSKRYRDRKAAERAATPAPVQAPAPAPVPAPVQTPVPAPVPVVHDPPEEQEIVVEEITPPVAPVPPPKPAPTPLPDGPRRFDPERVVWQTRPDNPHNKVTNLINGHDYRRHGTHAWCAREREGLCVTHEQHLEMLSKSQKTAEELIDWYCTVIEKYQGQPIGESAYVFWRNELSQWIGVTTRPATAKRSKARPNPLAAEIEAGIYDHFGRRRAK